MTWESEIAEIAKRKELSKARGGPEGVARQRRRGKLLVNERVDGLLDPGSLQEFMSLVGTPSYDDSGDLVGFTPKGAIEGFGKINGRKVIVSAGDFTVRGGSGGGDGSSTGLGSEKASNLRALEWRLPYIRLLDSAGGSVRGFETLGRTYLPDGNTWSTIDTDLLRNVPVVSAVMGSVAGLPAVNACMAHFTIMVKGISQLFPGGPPVVKAALGYDITKEDLGDENVHVYQSGSVDNLAEDEEDAFRQIRQYLSYLPQNIYELPPRAEPTDDPNRREARLRRLIPRDPRRAYDGHRAINWCVDEGSFFEIAPFYGRSRITGLARINGYPVGVMANNPMHEGGSTDVKGGSKVIRLIQLCDTFHLPLISFADEPGFMVGLESEKLGIERAGARLVMTTCQSQMPWATVVMGRIFGVAGQCQHRPSGMYQRWAWPSGRWGSMHIEGGAMAAYRREIDESDDPDAKRDEIENRLRDLASPFRTAEATGQDIIDPADTRPLLCEFVEDAQAILKTQLGPCPYPYMP